MKIINQHEITAGRTFQFRCPYCKAILEADESEFTPARGALASTLNMDYLRYICPVCKCNRYIDRDQLVQV